MSTNFIDIGVIIIALLHLWFFILEMFLWQKPIGLKIFKLSPTEAKISARLAANQGLYNLFLSAGLVWSLFIDFPMFAIYLQIFFLSCIAIAGIYAGITVNRRIFLVQALPALIVLALIFLR